MTKKIFGDYYLGLDIGTDSVGWAVADKDYNILNFNGKAMWGIHLFDSGNTAEDRRIHRIARRRLERRKQRIKLLQEIFADEMNKVDPKFFERLNDSFFQIEDRKHKTHDTIFNDSSFKDKDYFKKYPTIYHVRNALMEWNEKKKPDIRLLYLACHHIIKYRGHFLFENLSTGDIPPFEIVFQELIETLNSECGTEFESASMSSIAKEILSDKNLGVKEKTKKFQEIFVGEGFPDLIEELCKLLSGGTANLDNMFGNNADSKLDKLTFKNTDFDEAITKLESQIPEKIEILTRAKTIYDWALLNDLLDGNGGSISKAKIKTYEQHREDLKLLKSILKEDSEKYFDVFKSEDITMKVNNKNIKVNYSAYSGIHKKGTTDTDICSQADFCKYLRTAVFKTEFGDPVFKNKFGDMVGRIENDTFMPKQTIKDNSLFPNALHQHELKEILKNVEKHYPFLNEKDESECNSKEKIIKICTFKIPYYVGPLNKKSDRSWLERKEGKIMPWNFEDKVDIDQSAKNFMNKLIGNCTYLKEEKVVPKRSLIYQRFELYNEINILEKNRERIFEIDPRLKQDFVRDLFEDSGSKKITEKVIENWLRKKCQYHKDDKISGIDNEIKSSLKSEKQLRDILGPQMNCKIAEDIVSIITVFGGDKSRMRAKLQKDYTGILEPNQIEKLSKLTFKDWGRLSEKFLTGIYATINDEEMNILTALEKTSMNLQELLSEKYEFKKQIDELNETDNANNSITYDLLDDLYVSPKVKRGIWRSLRIIQDILKVTGHPPAKVFIETTREKQESKRTTSRKDNLLKLYEACKKDSSDLNNLLDEVKE
jgi:CRISPR-associated protein Cas9/Csn1, subtype II/NMEMI